MVGELGGVRRPASWELLILQDFAGLSLVLSTLYAGESGHCSSGPGGVASMPTPDRVLASRAFFPR